MSLRLEHWPDEVFEDEVVWDDEVEDFEVEEHPHPFLVVLGTLAALGLFLLGFAAAVWAVDTVRGGPSSWDRGRPPAVEGEPAPFEPRPAPVEIGEVAPEEHLS